MCVHVAKHSCNTHVCITRHRCLLITKSQGRSLGSHGKRGKAEEEEEEENKNENENNSHGESLNLLKIPDENREKSNDLLLSRRKRSSRCSLFTHPIATPLLSNDIMSLYLSIYLFIYLSIYTTQQHPKSRPSLYIYIYCSLTFRPQLSQRSVFRFG